MQSYLLKIKEITLEGYSISQQEMNIKILNVLDNIIDLGHQMIEQKQLKYKAKCKKTKELVNFMRENQLNNQLNDHLIDFSNDESMNNNNNIQNDSISNALSDKQRLEIDYQKLEKMLQKYEAEVRNHIRVE